MKLISMVKTWDGHLHEDACAARRHLEEKAGEQITAIAHLIAKTEGKFSKAVSLAQTDEMEKRFKALMKNREDMQLEKEEE